MSKRRIEAIKDIVKNVLVIDIESRNSDNKLYVEVCKTIAKQEGLQLETVTFIDFFMGIASKHYPSFECVSRTRRKIQEEYPFLVADDIIENFRKEQEKAYKEFARK